MSASQAWVSTSWKPGVADVEPAQATSDSRKVTTVVASAAQRALERTASLVAAQAQDEGRADERQDEEAGEDAEAEHQRAPVARYQVTRAATPISMAKA